VDGSGRLTEPAPLVVGWGNWYGDACLSSVRHQYTSKSDHTRFVHTICGDKAPFPHLAKGGRGAFAGDGRRQYTNVMWFDLGGLVCGMARNSMARSGGILRSIAEDSMRRSRKVVFAQTWRHLPSEAIARQILLALTSQARSPHHHAGLA
jgi:hypothetical protein